MHVSLHAAYFGFNFGDTLLCRMFCDWLRAAGATHINLPLADETNRALIGADSIGLGGFARARAVLFCGGGYFSESYRRPLVWTARHALRFDTLLQASKHARKPYAIMGVGAGPLSVGVARALTRSAFQGTRDAIVRDTESRDFLRGIGVTDDLAVAADAVALCSPATLRGGARAGTKAPVPPAGRRIFLHLAPNPDAQEIAVAINVLDFAARRPDVAVIIGNDYHDARHPDGPPWPAGILRRAALPGANVHVDHYDGEPASLIALLDGCDLVVTPKLHVGIAATVLEKFVIAIPNHSKTPRYYREIGQPDHCLSAAGDWRAPLAALLARWDAGETPDWSKRRALQGSFSYEDRIRAFLNDV